MIARSAGGVGSDHAGEPGRRSGVGLLLRSRGGHAGDRDPFGEPSASPDPGRGRERGPRRSWSAGPPAAASGRSWPASASTWSASWPSWWRCARLPLFAVQAIIAANLAVTAVFAAWLMHVRLGLREWLAVTGVVVGVGLLGSSAGAEGAAHVGFAFQLGLIVTVAGVAVAGLAAARLPNPYRTPVLGASAGLGYAVLAVAARILPGFSPQQLVRDPGHLHAGRGRDRLVHAVRVGAGGRQRDRGHRGRGAGRDHAAGGRGRAVPRRLRPGTG